jgi:hypothetical protein
MKYAAQVKTWRRVHRLLHGCIGPNPRRSVGPILASPKASVLISCAFEPEGLASLVRALLLYRLDVDVERPVAEVKMAVEVVHETSPELTRNPL